MFLADIYIGGTFPDGATRGQQGGKRSKARRTNGILAAFGSAKQLMISKEQEEEPTNCALYAELVENDSFA